MEQISVKIKNDTIIRQDLQYHFISRFNMRTGLYIRSNVMKDGKQTDEEPFMASFPHLIDVGIMGHCEHGKSGLCAKAGIDCYQSGMLKEAENMTLENFKRIADECEGFCDQFALGGRGDPDCHEHFEEILQYCREKHIVPNYTTSGFLFNERKAELSKKYCGAVAVSWYRNEYTKKAISLLLDKGVKTNIHYVLGKNSIDEAIERLRGEDFPRGINAVIFLLYKPAGQGSEKNMLTLDDERLKVFFDLALERDHPFKIGFDSCSVPGIVNHSRSVAWESLDTCEGGRFSMYIGSDMIATPCSFDVDRRYGVDISGKTVKEAWDSEQFGQFRDTMRNACPGCEKRAYCLGGCPLMKHIVLCPER